MEYTAETTDGAEDGVKGSALRPRVHPESVLLVAPSDCDEGCIKEEWGMVRCDPAARVAKHEVTHFQGFGSSGDFSEYHLTRAGGKEEASNDDVNCMVEDAGLHGVLKTQGRAEAVEVPEEPGGDGPLPIGGVVDLVNRLQEGCDGGKEPGAVFEV